MSWLDTRPLGIWILIVIVAWRCMKALEMMTRRDHVADKVLFRLIDAEYIYTALLVSILVTHIATLWGLFRPAPIWLWVAVIAMSLWVAEHVIAYVVALRHPEQAKDAYRISRASRGLPVREKALDFAVNPKTSLVMLLLSLALCVVWFLILISHRSYFS